MSTWPPTQPRERYDESLKLLPLRDGRVLASFDFKAVLHDAVPRDPQTLGEQDNPQHYNAFPLALGQILREHAIAELDLTLNAGRWRYDDWGVPHHEMGSASTGGELKAWMADGGPKSVDVRWSGLLQSLSGLFCASLSSMNNQKTTSPSHTFLHGPLPVLNMTYLLRHATLSSENVCTENLIPFVKLLPCAGHAGLGELLEPHQLFGADWHGLRVHIGWDPEEGVVVRLGVNAVFDPVRTSSEGRRDWSLGSLFKRSLQRSCHAAASSTIHVRTPPASVLSPSSKSIADGLATYDVQSAPKPLNISLRWHDEDSFMYAIERQPSLSPLSVNRIITTPDQSRGTLHISVINNEMHVLDVLYTETLPPLVTLYLHTRAVTVDGTPFDHAFELLRYVPTRGTVPTLLEARLRIPAGQKMHITFALDKHFLRYTEHPPDAQRGREIPGAIFVPLLPSSPNGAESSFGPVDGARTYIHSRALLLDLATPDFSMPYNVILMTCILASVICARVFKTLTGHFVVVEVVDGSRVGGGSGGRRAS